LSTKFPLGASLLLTLGCATPHPGGDPEAADALPFDRLGPPALRASALLAREPFTLEVAGAAPGSTVLFLRGSAISPGAACPAALGGACVDLVAPAVLGSVVADGSGRAALTRVAPGGASPGSRLYVQAVDAGGAWIAPAQAVVVQRPLPILGAWSDAYGGYHEIDAQRWRDDFGGWRVTVLDVAARFAVAQNDASNFFFPGLWSRFDWTWYQGQAWYCQTAYAAPDETAALATTPADPTRPDVSGCGGFSWTALTPEDPEIVGAYATNFGGTVDVTADVWDEAWSSWTISRFSNLDRVIIARNDRTNPFAAGLWSRFDWAEVGGRLFYCQTAYDAPSEWAARGTPRADDHDPATTGCGGGFPWTELL
jgi:hypothetical protein